MDVIGKGQKSGWREEISFRHKQLFIRNRQAKTELNNQSEVFNISRYEEKHILFLDMICPYQIVFNSSQFPFT